MKHLFFVIFILTLTLPHSLLAAGAFNKNFILDDGEFFNSHGMTLAEVQRFLESKNSALARYVATDTDGALRSAAEVIWRTGLAFGINPKFFLVLLQKEQSLVEAKNITQYQIDWATGYARCDHCSQDHPDIQDVKGLAAQIYLAGQWINKKYVPDLLSNGKTKAGFGPGITKKIDRNVNVKPENKATSILYTYTPHIAGNKQFWKIWNRWFSPLYPDGTLLQDKKSGGVWLIEAGKKRPFLSKAALTANYDSNLVVQVESNDLDRYPKGEPITQKTAEPVGTLMQDVKTGGVFLVQGGRRQPILDKQILNLYFKGRKITQANAAQLLKFTTTDPVKFQDGEMVGLKEKNQIFIISNGLRRPISKEVLLALGFDSRQIVWTKTKLLDLHAIGEPIVYTTANPTALDVGVSTTASIDNVNAVQANEIIENPIILQTDSNEGYNL